MNRTIVLAVLLITQISYALAEAPFIVKDRTVVFVGWVYTLSAPVTDHDTVMEIREVPCVMPSNTKLWVLSSGDRTPVEDKLDELDLHYVVTTPTVTPEQSALKLELDGKYWTKAEVLAAGMPDGN